MIQRELETRFEVEPPVAELIVNTQCAIADATDYDERQINHNFDYDYGAYETIQRNFRSLIAAGRIEDVMELSLSLMRAGSHQVEMSDEGLMADDIEECLKNVGEAERDCRDEASVQLGREARSRSGNSHPLRRDADNR